MRRQFILSSIVFVFSVISVQLSGEVRQVTLPAEYSDFAIHPETGNIAALSAERDEVVLISHESLESGAGEVISTVKVGSTPCSIVHKKFDSLSLFAIVCSQDSNMYIINAGGSVGGPKNDFQLLKKIELAQSGVSLVTSSINSQDPFLYYCYGSGHDSQTGVVSLRDMRSHGMVFGNSMDCAISASGEFAYRRGPWSPSGFESLNRTNLISDTTPSFSRFFYDHNSTQEYIPDPFDRFTATGRAIFTRELDKRVASLDFVPLCFSAARPFVFGTIKPDGYPQNRGVAILDKNVALQAASCNTFTKVGERVVIQRPNPTSERPLPRGVESQADFKRLMKRTRFFADDARKRILLVEGNLLHVVPMDDFKLPDEPFLLARLEYSGSLLCDQESEINLVPSDKRVELIVDDVPDGMKLVGNKLTWRPRRDQIGDAKIVVTLKHGEIQRTQQFDLTVAYPSFKLPFAPTEFAIDDSGKHAAIWDSPNRPPHGPQQQPTSQNTKLAIINLETKKVEVSRELIGPIRNAILTPDHLIFTSQPDSPRCEVFLRSDLQRAASFMASGPIFHLEKFGDAIVIQSEQELDIYSASTLKRVKSFTVKGDPNESLASQHGIFVNGILYGFDSQPKLLVHPGQILSMGSNHGNVADASGLKTKIRSGQPQTQIGIGGLSPNRISTEEVPGMNTRVGLEYHQRQLQVPGATHTPRFQIELTLMASGAVDDRRVILRQNRLMQQTNGPAPTGLMHVAKDAVFVLFEKDLFRWSWDQQGKQPTPIAPSNLSLVPKQSTLTIKPSGKTQLKHELQGAMTDVTFSLITSSENIEINENSGVVTINNEAIMKEALKAVEMFVRKSNHGESFTQTLRFLAGSIAQHITMVLGRKPEGFPVAIPIAVTAHDTNLSTSSLPYFVIAEVPVGPLLSKLTELDNEREKQMAKMQTANEPQSKTPDGGAQQNTNPQLSEMQRKIDALEQRMDLMTRQLNEVLKRVQ